MLDCFGKGYAKLREEFGVLPRGRACGFKRTDNFEDEFLEKDLRRGETLAEELPPLRLYWSVPILFIFYGINN